IQDDQEPLPLCAESKSGASNDGYPHHGAEKIEDYKRLPWHSQGTSQGSCNDAHAENETSKENGNCSVATKEFFSIFNCPLANTKDFSVSEQRWRPATHAEVVSQVVSQGCRHNPKQNYVLKLQSVF